MSKSRSPIVATVLLGAIVTANVAFCQALIPVGSEFQINTYATSGQHFPAVDMDGDGDFVVAWRSQGQDGSNDGVFARRFNAAGGALGAEFQVNASTASDQAAPTVGLDGDGDLVVAWESFYQDGSESGIFARRFNAAGEGLAAEFQVNAHTSNSQRYPAVGIDGDGDFVVAWYSYIQDGDGDGIFARRFNAAGVGLATEFQVNDYTSSDQRYPAVGMDGDGDFVVAWHSYGQDGSQSGIFARRFDSAGGTLGAEFQVNEYTSSYQRHPAVGMDGDGDFVVAWRSFFQDGSFDGVFARRFDAAGEALGAELQVNTYTSDGQTYPTVGMDADGDFVVAWHSRNGKDDSDDGVFARRFNAAGEGLGAEFQVNAYTSSHQQYPAVGMDGDGDFVVAWHSLGQDGSFEGVFAQRYVTLAILDIDGNGATSALSDGLLVLRFLFGFTGATLTNGAVDVGGCTRCTAPDIEAYLETLT